MEHQEGRPPTEDEIFYSTWGRETVKNNITLCNDILKQLITISSALLGVTIIFDTVVTENYFKILVVFSFFASIVLAFIGLLPYERTVRLDTPADIKMHKQKALKHKRCYLWTSAFTLVIGFAFIIAELLLKTFVK
jgi:hypothetical protein